MQTPIDRTQRSAASLPLLDWEKTHDLEKFRTLPLKNKWEAFSTQSGFEEMRDSVYTKTSLHSRHKKKKRAGTPIKMV